MSLRFFGLLCLSFWITLDFVAADEPADVAASFADRLSTFDQVHVEFSKRPANPQKSAKLPVFAMQKSFARKGTKRYYNVLLKHIAGPKPDREMLEYVRTGLTFDGQETRILFSRNHIRVFAGNEERQFDPSDGFLSLQGYPSEHFSTYDSARKEKVFFNFADFVDQYSLADTTSRGIVRLDGPGDRLFFDANRDYAIVKRQRLDESGEVTQQFEYSDFFQFKNCWLAKKIKQTTLAPVNERGTSITQLVSIRGDGIDDSLFQMPFHSNASVENFSIGKDDQVLVYVVPTDPEDAEVPVLPPTV